MSTVENAEAFGGEDKKELEKPEKNYCDKANHFFRSLFHQNNHIKHIEEALGPEVGKPRVETMSRIHQEWFIGHIPIIRSRNQK